MSEPARRDLRLYRGDTFTLPVRLWEDAVGGTPVDLAGVTGAAEIREVIGGALLATFTVLIVVPNEISLTLPASEWTDFPARSNAVWDLELAYPGGVVRTILAGFVAIAGDVTNP